MVYLKNSLTKPLFTNAWYLTSVNLMQAFVGFVFWGFATRLYQLEDLGIASATISAASLISGIANLGVGVGLIRFLPVSRSPRRLLNTAFTFSGITALLFTGVYIAGIRSWSPSLAVLSANWILILVFVLFTLAMTLEPTLQMAYTARRRAVYALAQTSIINISRLVLVGIFTKFRVVGLLLSISVSVIFAIILGLFFFLPKVEQNYWPRPEFFLPDFFEIIPFSLGNHIANILSKLPQLVMPLLVLELLGPASSGHAYIAWMIGMLLASPGLAIAHSAFAEGSNNSEQWADIFSKSVIFGLAIAIPITISVYWIAPWLLALFGNSYVKESTTLLRWLAATTPLTVISGIYFTKLRLKKEIGKLICFCGITSFCTIAISVGFLPATGIPISGVGWLIGNGIIAAIYIKDLSGWILYSRRNARMLKREFPVR